MLCLWKPHYSYKDTCLNRESLPVFLGVGGLGAGGGKKMKGLSQRGERPIYEIRGMELPQEYGGECLISNESSAGHMAP